MDELESIGSKERKEMRYFNRPIATDVANLRSLARNKRLDSYPELADAFRDVLESYLAYRNVSGNAKAGGAPRPLLITETLKTALRSHYGSPPASIDEFISGLRRTASPDVCPMCGSPKTGTLDHIFPKTVFAELSFFSLNLVPACDCNTKRNADYVGTGNDDRVLHPYFDTIMRERLVRARFELSHGHGYDRPRISLMIVIPVGSANYPPVKYHVDHVLARTDVLNHMDATWPKITNRPSDYFNLANGNISLPDLRQAVEEVLAKRDRHFKTPNNWDSILFSGILEDDNVIRFLQQRISNIRDGTYSPRDDV